MSYRDDLIRLREDLVDTDRAIGASELQMPSLAGRVLLGRARGFIRAAQGLITAALKTPHDSAPPPCTAPATAESRR